MRSRLDGMAESIAAIGEVRGLGPMLGIEVVDADGRPDGATTAAVIANAWDKGLIVMGAGVDGNVIRVLVPLVATEADIEEGMRILEASFQEATNE